jgi:hypothetical protein
MKGEINKDFYCSANRYRPEKPAYDRCGGAESCDCQSDTCPHHHRKYPTPEQFKEEYGEEYAGHRPVWWKYADDNGIWRTKSYNAAMGVQERLNREGGLYSNILIVCACTPWDRPPADWRPE